MAQGLNYCERCKRIPYQRKKTLHLLLKTHNNPERITPHHLTNWTPHYLSIWTPHYLSLFRNERRREIATSCPLSDVISPRFALPASASSTVNCPPEDDLEEDFKTRCMPKSDNVSTFHARQKWFLGACIWTYLIMCFVLFVAHAHNFPTALVCLASFPRLLSNYRPR